MEDILTMIGRLKRPHLLVQTARHGIEDYSRPRHLRRLLKTETLPRHADAIMRLMQLEAEHNDLRLAERADYAFARHIEILIALMCEARDLKAARRSRGRVLDPIPS